METVDFPRDYKGFKKWRAKQGFTGELDTWANIVEKDKMTVEQADEKGTPSTILRFGVAEREEKFKAMLKAHLSELKE